VKFDYTTVIGRDPKLFEFHVKNVLENAGISRDHWGFWVYVYYNEGIPDDTTDEILATCDEFDIKYELHYESPHEPFIQRLYKAWNRVQLMGNAPLTIRGGSDQTFYPESFLAALEHYECLSKSNECVINFQTIEHVRAKQSRHFTVDCGDCPNLYDAEKFVEFCKGIYQQKAVEIEEAKTLWNNHPGPFGSSLGNPWWRGDGCSWIQSKELFRRFGPMPNMRHGVTGDVWIHDEYERNGIPSYIAGDAITYHMVKGESRGVQ